MVKPVSPRMRAVRASAKAVTAELLGALLFQLVAGSTRDSLAVAFAYATIQYAIKYVSGGHLNPAVSLAAAGSGHIRMQTGLMYAVAHILGSFMGAGLQAFMVPGARLGYQSVACLIPSDDINGWQLFFWEFFLGLLFIGVQYSALFILPGHGDVAPLTSGIALFAILDSVGDFTGYSPVNPARTLASAVTFDCFGKYVWVYLGAELLAAVAASLLAVTYWGKGAFFKHAGHEHGHEQGAAPGTSYEESLLPGTTPEGGGAVTGAGVPLRRDLTFAPEGLED